MDQIIKKLSYSRTEPTCTIKGNNFIITYGHSMDDMNTFNINIEIIDDNIHVNGFHIYADYSIIKKSEIHFICSKNEPHTIIENNIVESLILSKLKTILSCL